MRPIIKRIYEAIQWLEKTIKSTKDIMMKMHCKYLLKDFRRLLRWYKENDEAIYYDWRESENIDGGYSINHPLGDMF